MEKELHAYFLKGRIRPFGRGGAGECAKRKGARTAKGSKEAGSKKGT